jgi:predicted GNAT family N-acyltransferase
MASQPITIQKLEKRGANSDLTKCLANTYNLAFKEEAVHNFLYCPRYCRLDPNQPEYDVLLQFRHRELKQLISCKQTAVWIAFLDSGEPIGYVLYRLPDNWMQTRHRYVGTCVKRLFCSIGSIIQSSVEGILTILRIRPPIFDNRALATYLVKLIESQAFSDEGAVRILHLVVRPDYWRNGIGSELIRASISEIKNAGHERQPFAIDLLASEWAVPLYCRLGFHTVGEIVLCDGVTITKMQAIVSDACP